MKLVKEAKGYVIRVNDDAPVNRFKPSVDYLFNSIASLKVKNLIGVILTGMGKDGAQGLLEIKKSGGFTIDQDKNLLLYLACLKRP